MGAFYVNYIIKGVESEAVFRVMTGRKAFVSTKRHGYVFVFDHESDAQNQDAIAKLAAPWLLEFESRSFATGGGNAKVLSDAFEYSRVAEVERISANVLERVSRRH